MLGAIFLSLALYIYSCIYRYIYIYIDIICHNAQLPFSSINTRMLCGSAGRELSILASGTPCPSGPCRCLCVPSPCVCLSESAPAWSTPSNFCPLVGCDPLSLMLACYVLPCVDSLSHTLTCTHCLCLCLCLCLRLLCLCTHTHTHTHSLPQTLSRARSLAVLSCCARARVCRTRKRLYPAPSTCGHQALGVLVRESETGGCLWLKGEAGVSSVSVRHCAGLKLSVWMYILV